MSAATPHTHPAPRDAPPAARGKGLFSRLRPLVRLIGHHRRLLWWAILSGAINHLIAIASAVTGAYLVSRAAKGATTAELQPYLILLVILIVPQTVTPWLESFFAHVMAFRVLVDIRDRVHEAFARLAPGYLLDRRTGDLGSTVIADVELLELFFAHTLSPLVVAVVVPFAATVTLALIHWTLPFVLIPALFVVATVPSWLQRRAETQGREVRDRAGEVGAEVVDAIQGLREVLVFDAGERELRRLGAAGGRLYRAQLAHGRRSGVERAGVDVIVTVGMLAVLVAAAALATGGSIDVVLFPPAVVLAAFTFHPVTTLVDSARDLNLVAAAAERVDAILTAPTPVPDLVTEAPAAPVDPRIDFADVSFRYRPDLPDALGSVSFGVAPGETVALVGHSGAGKSTSAHLLLRFWDVTGGRITVGGHDLRELPQHLLRELVTFVPQDTYLFHTSVAENIRLGRPDATDDEVRAAARQALADEFITALPDGYDTLVGERGAKLSGGQRQRIALARAVIKDSPILVMDEPVSNLDAESERELAVAMDQARKGRTVLVIAHRLSTIKTADRLVVLDRGRVAEVGRHDDLVASGGTYARLVSSQQAGGPG